MCVTAGRFEGRWLSERPPGLGVYWSFDGQIYKATGTTDASSKATATSTSCRLKSNAASNAGGGSLFLQGHGLLSLGLNSSRSAATTAGCGLRIGGSD